MAKYKVEEMARIESLIFSIRGLRVMIDADLARIYGIELKRLNEQVRRNAGRFPNDFAFQLTHQEFAGLKSQFATSKTHGGRRKLPWVFTEHGALMLASILNSPVAVDASVRVVRAFVLMREQLTANKELAGKLADLEKQVGGHDAAINNLFEAIRQLIEPPVSEERKQIGFMRETATPYRIKVSSKKRF